MSSSTVIIPSTGQTQGDLDALRMYLFDNPLITDAVYFEAGWMPPSFTDPSYVPPKQDGMRIGLTVAFTFGMALTAAVVLIKIITTQRYRSTKVLFIEDWLLLLALLSGYSVLIISLVTIYKYQAGWHVYDVHASSLEWTYKLILLVDILTVWVYTVTRISLLLSIRRLYSGLRTRMQRICDVLVICKLIYLIGSICALVFEIPSQPGALFNIWQATIHHARPMQPTIGICATTLALDCVILLSPLPLITKLKGLPARRKVQIFLLFFLGFLTITASASRLWQVVSLRDAIVNDITWYTPVLELVNFIEMMLALLTSCLPSAKFFFRWAYEKDTFPMHQRQSYNNQQGLVELESYVSDTLTSRSEFPPSYKVEFEIAPAISHDPPPAFTTKTVTLLEDGEEDDDNFYDHLQPSESFFPSATGLSPRPRC